MWRVDEQEGSGSEQAGGVVQASAQNLRQRPAIPDPKTFLEGVAFLQQEIAAKMRTVKFVVESVAQRFQEDDVLSSTAVMIPREYTPRLWTEIQAILRRSMTKTHRPWPRNPGSKSIFLESHFSCPCEECLTCATMLRC
jgi:hypothetical protein